MASPLILLVAVLLTGTLYGLSRPSPAQSAIQQLFAGLARSMSWLAVMVPLLVVGPLALISMLAVHILIPLVIWTVLFVLVRVAFAAVNLLSELDCLPLWQILPQWAWHGLGTVITGVLIYFVWHRPPGNQTPVE